jgi:hypothetical protein
MVKDEEGRKQRDVSELTIEELERQEGFELPHREALSPLSPRLPIDPALVPEMTTGDVDHGGQAATETPHDPPTGT